MSLIDDLKKSVPLISAGVLSAHLGELGESLKRVENTAVKMLHFDVMDGCFCPMLTFGPPVIAAVKSPMLKDVHLMIKNPIPKLADFVQAGADIVTLHVESDPGQIHMAFKILSGMENANDPARGIVRGIALNPGTPAVMIEPLLGQIDMVMLLAVNPGWLGQKFDGSVWEKYSQVKDMLDRSGKKVLIGIDGGVSRENIHDIAQMGVDVVVAGGAIFGGGEIEKNINMLANALDTE
jgi:ribulose-phosphate 3-epimerase